MFLPHPLSLNLLSLWTRLGKILYYAFNLHLLLFLYSISLYNKKVTRFY